MGSTSRHHWQPLRFGEMISRMVSLYRANFLLFAGVVAVLAIPQAILLAIIGPHLRPPLTYTKTPGGEQSVVHFHWHRHAIYALLAIFLISVFFSAITNGALARAVSARYLEMPISIIEAYIGIGFKTFLILLAASGLYIIAVTICSIFLLVPGIWVAVLFVFTTQAVVLEHRGVIDSLGRSRELVRDSWWRIFGIGLATVLGLGIVTAIIDQILAATVSYPIETIPSTIVTIVIQPLELGIFTLLYYDRRVRRGDFGTPTWQFPDQELYPH